MEPRTIGGAANRMWPGGMLAIVGIALVAAGTGPSRAQTGSAPAISSLCFELFPAVGQASPALLLDKCSGRTWHLVRSRIGSGRATSVVYRWREIAQTEPDAAAGAAQPQAARRPAARGNCFAFNGRTFCE
jgi:hypothetical protein